MKKSRYTEEHIAFSLRQIEAGMSVKDVVRKMGITEQTFYRWKKKYGGMGVAEVRRLTQLEDENRRLKQMVADLRLGKAMLQDVPSKKGLRTARKREMVRKHERPQRRNVTA